MLFIRNQIHDSHIVSNSTPCALVSENPQRRKSEGVKSWILKPKLGSAEKRGSHNRPQVSVQTSIIQLSICNKNCL